MLSNKGRLFIISGPSGSGKDTLLVKLFKAVPEIKFSISSITRPIRENEKPGEKYNFISKDEFENMIKNNELLEYNQFVGNYYGTPKAPVIKAIENGDDIVVEVYSSFRHHLKRLKPVFTTEEPKAKKKYASVFCVLWMKLKGLTNMIMLS